jgi:hypothetical protein
VGKPGAWTPVLEDVVLVMVKLITFWPGWLVTFPFADSP